MPKTKFTLRQATLVATVTCLAVPSFATAAPDQAKLSQAAYMLKQAAIMVKIAGPDRAGHTFKAMADIEAAINEVKAAVGP